MQHVTYESDRRSKLREGSLFVQRSDGYLKKQRDAEQTSSLAQTASLLPFLSYVPKESSHKRAITAALLKR